MKEGGKPGGRQPMGVDLMWVTVIAIIVCFVTLCGKVLFDSHADVAVNADKTAMNLVEVIRRDITRTFEQFDLSLQGVQQALDSPDFERVSREGKNLLLFDRSSFATHFASIVVTDADGHVLFDSVTLNPGRQTIADRMYFKVHRDKAGIGLFTSEPFQSRDASFWEMAISRRLNNPDGSFRGVVAGSIRLDYFTALLANLDIGPEGAITLFHSSGAIIMRAPYALGALGRHLGSGRPFVVDASAPSLGVAPSIIDGITRRYTTVRIGNLPIVLNIGLALRDIYGPWRQRVTVLGMLMAILVVATSFLSVLLRREARKLRLKEQQLRQAIDFTELLASTDGLTGLANRRSLDDRLDVEWRNADRPGSELACLMIDVDYFKRLNDSCGHAEGDEALRRIAQSIDSSLSRPLDFASRYGGEEFCVLMPGTGRDGAYEVARKIRTAVTALSIPNPEAPLGIATVSVGLAVRDAIHADPDSLVKEADTALYLAKQAGRNTIAAARAAAAWSSDGGHHRAA